MAPVWDTATDRKLLLAVIDQDAKPDWTTTVQAMGGHFTYEGCRQRYAKLKREAAALLEGDAAATHTGGTHAPENTPKTPKTPKTPRKRKVAGEGSTSNTPKRARTPRNKKAPQDIKADSPEAKEFTIPTKTEDETEAVEPATATKPTADDA